MRPVVTKAQWAMWLFVLFMLGKVDPSCDIPFCLVYPTPFTTVNAFSWVRKKWEKIATWNIHSMERSLLVCHKILKKIEIIMKKKSYIEWFPLISTRWKFASHLPQLFRSEVAWKRTLLLYPRHKNCGVVFIKAANRYTVENVTFAFLSQDKVDRPTMKRLLNSGTGRALCNIVLSSFH